MRLPINQSVARGCRQNRVMLAAGLALMFLVILAAAPAPLQAASQVTELMLNDQADAQGVVAEHRSTFPASTDKIYGTALIAGAKKGQAVTTELFYMTRNLNVFSSTDDLPNDGEVTLTFAFPKPDKGWPKGDYKLVVTTADRASKTVTFQVK